jgi:hypothetical protein
LVGRDIDSIERGRGEREEEEEHVK